MLVVGLAVLGKLLVSMLSDMFPNLCDSQTPTLQEFKEHLDDALGHAVGFLGLSCAVPVLGC